MEQLPSIEKSAHRTEVRCLAFSSDDMLIASGSAESLKIWNRSVKNSSEENLRIVLDIVVNPFEQSHVLMHCVVCSYQEITWY